MNAQHSVSGGVVTRHRLGGREQSMHFWFTMRFEARAMYYSSEAKVKYKGAEKFRNNSVCNVCVLCDNWVC